MKILFVCMGNICRSPLAEGLCRKLTQEAGLGERDVHDPYFDGDFERTYRQVEAGCRGLLQHLIQQPTRDT